MCSRKSMSTLFIFLVINLSLHAQPDKYQRPAVISDLHNVYEYKKSNWDGTHASTIYLYVADTNKLESFKWTRGDKVATLVTALFDWGHFSVQQFTNHRLRSGNDRELVATLTMKGEKMIGVEVGDMKDSLLLAGLPWQSYDFDFAGLGFAWRALKDKRSSFYFHIADAAMVNGNMAFVNKGKVLVDFEGMEHIKGKNCLRYRIDGPGLENKGGLIWINAASFMIEQYKIALPDEPGFENGMLVLMTTTRMNPQQWDQFKTSNREMSSYFPYAN